MSKRKKDNDIIVSTIGGQSTDVTGSMTLISYVNSKNERRTLLLEMGMQQGNASVLQTYRDNLKMVQSLDLGNIDYVFNCHSHCDHTGMLPYLTSHGFKGRIITTYAQNEITKKLLEDSAYIHQKDIDYLRAKGYKLMPIYTQPDAYKLFDFADVYEIGVKYDLTDCISFRYRNNSHVVGATQLELWIKKPSGQIKKILLTSDLGSKVNLNFTPFLKETEIVPKANLVLMESTYGGKASFSKQECIDERRFLINKIREYVLQNNRRVFIPTFSFGRLQSLMCMLYEAFKDDWDYEKPIVIDTKLGNTINSVYDRILDEEDAQYWEEVKNWGGFKFIRDYKGTIAFLSKYQPSVILSSAGMVNAGHSTVYASQILSCSKDLMVFSGYCSPNTIGGKILNPEQKYVTIDGETLSKRCAIIQLHTFSSHAQEDDLIDYIKQLSCDKIVLHHGGKEYKEALKQRADEELHKINKTTPVVCSTKGMQIKL